jgi:hypothetical protein
LRPQPRERKRLFAGQLDQRCLLVKDLLCHRDAQRHRRSEQFAKHRGPLGTGQPATLSSPTVVLKDALYCWLNAVPNVDAVEQDLAWGVGRQHELVDRDVRERDRVNDQHFASAPTIDCVDLAL